MRVREVAPGDHEVVGELTVEAYRTAPGAPRSRHFDEVYAPTLRDVAGRAAEAVVLVATIDGAVVGAVTYVPGPGPLAEFDESDAAGIRHLAVSPRAQGRGVGRALMEACLQRARAEGRRTLVLHTQPHMAAAQTLYGSLGFVRAPERDFRPAPEIDLRGYVLDLAT